MPHQSQSSRSIDTAGFLFYCHITMVQEIRRDEDLLSTSEAAARLGVSRQRVRDLVAHGQLHARRVGNSVVIERSAVEARRAARPGPGRPFSPRRAWAILVLAEGSVPGWLDAVSRSKLRSVLRSRNLADLRPRLVARADRSEFRAHPSDLSRIAAEQGVLRTGASAAVAVGIDLVAPGLLDAYVSSERFDEIVKRYRLRESGDPNVTLRRVPEDVPFFDGRAVAPRAAVALDLLDEADPRSREAGKRALARFTL